MKMNQRLDKQVHKDEIISTIIGAVAVLSLTLVMAFKIVLNVMYWM